MRVIGVTSHAYDASDCESKGGVDTRVDAYLDWIESELVSRCEDGSRAWCDEMGIVEAPLPSLADGDTADESSRGACACSSTSPSPAPWFAMVGLSGLIGLRRRG